MKTYTFYNQFHNTSASMRIPEGDYEEFVVSQQINQHQFFELLEWRASVYPKSNPIWKDKVARLKKKLCGIKECKCGVVR